jgi:hypothetical protein
MPIEIGKTYLDTWGHIHKIYGHVQDGPMWAKKSILTQVWSISSHFETKTGKNVGGGSNLVDDFAMAPADAEKYWLDRIAEIKAVNSKEKLTLVADLLTNMRKRARMWKLLASKG